MFYYEILEATFCRKTYPLKQDPNVTTQFALMMEALHMYIPEYCTET